jgi:hypothetical protein
MITWGAVLMCNAAVKNKGGLYATRFLLGVVRIHIDRLDDSKGHLDVQTANREIGRGWTIPWCNPPDDLLVPPR